MTPFRSAAADRNRVLADASVLVVGLGGLGCPAALALARDGIGHLGLVDFDCIDLSNLPRQPLYAVGDVGQPKAAVASRELRRLFPRVRITPFECELTIDTFAEVSNQFHFVVDGTDQVAAKYLINDQCVLSGIAFSYAGVVGLEGQLMTVLPHQSACLRCLFPEPPDPADVPTCQQSGVLGGLVGCFGYLQAREAMEFCAGHRDTLTTDRLLTYGGTRAGWRSIAFQRNPRCPMCTAA